MSDVVGCRFPSLLRNLLKSWSQFSLIAVHLRIFNKITIGCEKNNDHVLPKTIFDA